MKSFIELLTHFSLPQLFQNEVTITKMSFVTYLDLESCFGGFRANKILSRNPEIRSHASSIIRQASEPLGHWERVSLSWKLAIYEVLRQGALLAKNGLPPVCQERCAMPEPHSLTSHMFRV